MAVKCFQIFIVDAFSKTPFSGNGAAVVIVPYDEVIPDEQLQKIAAEMNLSETAFVTPSDDTTMENGHEFQLRWFTPKYEVNLCGHATVATATVIMEVFGNKSNLLEFETLSGKLFARRSIDQKITIDLPSLDAEPVDANEFSQLIKAAVGNLPVCEVLICPSTKFVIRLNDTVTREQLEEIQPKEDELLSSAEGKNIFGCIVTLKGGNDSCFASAENQHYDFISRYFAPWRGILEDPVTGSAHAILAPYWGKVLNKKRLFARQCSLRGGELHMEINEDRILITGDSVIVVQGKISF